MKTNPPPGKRLVSDWVGMHVKVRRALGNSMVKIPAGSIMKVTSASPGLSLEGETCPHCGITPRVSRVEADDVEAAS